MDKANAAGACACSGCMCCWAAMGSLVEAHCRVLAEPPSQTGQGY